MRVRQMARRWLHKPKIAGSSPTPAITELTLYGVSLFYSPKIKLYGVIIPLSAHPPSQLRPKSAKNSPYNQPYTA